MAIFGYPYDRDFERPRRDPRFARYGSTAPYEPMNTYDRDMTVRRGYTGYGRDYDAADRYDREMRHKSRWQTDFGDPYGDRVSHTPMRMIRGDFHRGYGRDYDVGHPRDRWDHPAGYSRYDADLGWRGRPGEVGRWGSRERWPRRDDWALRSPLDRYDSDWY